MSAGFAKSFHAEFEIENDLKLELREIENVIEKVFTFVQLTDLHNNDGEHNETIFSMGKDVLFAVTNKNYKQSEYLMGHVIESYLRRSKFSSESLGELESSPSLQKCFVHFYELYYEVLVNLKDTRKRAAEIDVSMIKNKQDSVQLFYLAKSYEFKNEHKSAENIDKDISNFLGKLGSEAGTGSDTDANADANAGVDSKRLQLFQDATLAFELNGFKKSEHIQNEALAAQIRERQKAYEQARKNTVEKKPAVSDVLINEHKKLVYQKFFKKHPHIKSNEKYAEGIEELKNDSAMLVSPDNTLMENLQIILEHKFGSVRKSQVYLWAALVNVLMAIVLLSKYRKRLFGWATKLLK